MSLGSRLAHPEGLEPPTYGFEVSSQFALLRVRLDL